MVGLQKQTSASGSHFGCVLGISEGKRLKQSVYVCRRSTSKICWALKVSKLVPVDCKCKTMI